MSASRAQSLLRARLQGAVLSLALGLALLAPACVQNRSAIRRAADPKLVDPIKARAATAAGNWQLAASYWYELFLRNDENSPLACVEAARALVALEDPASAKSLLDEGLRRYPDHPDLLEMTGNVLVAAGFRRAAEPYYERAIDVAPERLSALLALARARVELSLEARAVPLLERRIALGGGDAETWLLLARAQRAAGNVHRSLEAYDRAFELGESHPERLLFAAGLYFEAGAEVREVVAPQRVLLWLERAAELDPQNTRAHEMIGRLRQETGDLEGAMTAYLRAIETDPADRSALRRGARLARQMGDYGRALELGERLVEKETNLGVKEEHEVWLLETRMERDRREAAPQPQQH